MIAPRFSHRRELAQDPLVLQPLYDFPQGHVRSLTLLADDISKGEIRGSAHIPSPDLTQCLSESSDGGEIVVYCVCSYLSSVATSELRFAMPEAGLLSCSGAFLHGTVFSKYRMEKENLTVQPDAQKKLRRTRWINPK